MPAEKNISIRMSSNGNTDITLEDKRDARNENLKTIKKLVSRNFYKLGFYTLPFSFSWLPEGAEAHYAGTLPTNKYTSIDGLLVGTKHCYVCDASTFLKLPEKTHTFTAIANADRLHALL